MQGFYDVTDFQFGSSFLAFFSQDVSHPFHTSCVACKAGIFWNVIHDFFFGNNIILPSFTFKILLEGWYESKTDFKGEVDGFNIREIPTPPASVFFLAFQDGGRDQCTSQFQAICCGLVESNWTNLPTYESPMAPDLAWALYLNYIPEVNAKSRSCPLLDCLEPVAYALQHNTNPVSRYT